MQAPSRLFRCLVPTLLLLGCAHAQLTDSEVTDLRQELIAMGKADQAALSMGKDSKDFKNVSSDNVDRLDAIIGRVGWPSVRRFGEQANDAAFLVVQHGSHSFQKRMLPILSDAASNGDAKMDQVATLTDQILVDDGQKQRFGTQMVDDGKGPPTPKSIEDEAHVDLRRAAVGLPPLSDSLKQARNND